MKKGGGQAKGGEWERQTGKHLSLWLTANLHNDIFSRNVMSGGSFTLRENRGERGARAPGDLMAAHPLAFAFLSKFSVECKHLKDIGLEAYMWDPKAGRMLGEIIKLARRQARSIGLEFMVIAKQNQRDPLVFVNGFIGHHFLEARVPAKRASILPMYHILHRKSVFVMRFEDMLHTVDPVSLLEGLNNGYLVNKRLAPG